MDALIVVDMQIGLLGGPPKYQLPKVIDRINCLSGKIRGEGGTVIWIRHCGSAGDAFERHTPGWEFLSDLIRDPGDMIVEKTLNDPFVGTSLGGSLARLRPRRVLVTGWATDFCVDAAVRSSISHDHNVVAVADAHTLSDRPHLPATAVIAHHNWVWRGLITHRSVRVINTAVEKGLGRERDFYNVMRRILIELNADGISLLHQHRFDAGVEVQKVLVCAFQSFETAIERLT